MATDEDDWAVDRARFLTLVSQPDRAAGELEHGPLAQEFATLTSALVEGPSVVRVLENVVLAAHDVVPDADLVSITLRAADGAFFTPVRTGPAADELDQLQYETGEGPCVEVADPSGPAHVRSEQLDAEYEWPSFGARAALLGFRALLAVALLPDAEPPRRSGALTIYSRQPRALLAEDREAALLLAVHASLALADTDARTRAELTEARLPRPPRSTELIDAAGDVLVRRRGLCPDEAFDLLSYAVQELNVKLAERPTDTDTTATLAIQ